MQSTLQCLVFSFCFIVQCWQDPHCNVQCSVFVSLLSADRILIAISNVQLLLHCSMLIPSTLQCPMFSSSYIVQCWYSPPYNVRCQMFSSCYIVQCWYSPHYYVQCSVLVTLFNVDITMSSVQFLLQCSMLIQSTLQCPMFSSCYIVQCWYSPPYALFSVDSEDFITWSADQNCLSLDRRTTLSQAGSDFQM